MTALIAELILLLVALPGQSLAQAVASLPEPAKDPFVGTWKANEGKSGPKYKDYTADLVTFSRDGDDLIASYRRKFNWGLLIENNGRMRCDGLLRKVQCGTFHCRSSCTYLTPNHIDGVFEGPVAKSYWTREVSPDGQEMTTCEYRDKAKKKLESLLVRNRVK
jgi:hypothetical protein